MCPEEIEDEILQDLVLQIFVIGRVSLQDNGWYYDDIFMPEYGLKGGEFKYAISN